MIDKKLNKRERYKAQMRPIDFYEQFETLDFENLGEGDRYFLQDFGIFNIDFLEDEFTIRIRVPGGRITSEQFIALAAIIDAYDLEMILTARAGIQLSGVEAENVLEVFKKVNETGLSTWQSFGDNIRNIVGDVYDGIGLYGELEAYPLMMAMQEYILKNPQYVGLLPRRISVGISGNRANLLSLFANDLYFQLAQKDDVYGYKVYMGGKNTEVAQDSDIFLLEDEVLDFFKAFVETFNQNGSRFSRSKTRLFYLLEDIGMEGFKAKLQEQYQKPFVSGAEIMLQKGDFEVNTSLKDGTYSFSYQSDFGRVSAQELQTLAQVAKDEACEIRFGIDQNIYFLGLKAPLTTLVSPTKSQNILACAGSEYCPYAFWSIKDESYLLPLDKINEHNITIGFSGCAKGCGRHRHTDIGLIGLKTNNFGDTEGGVRVFIGAEHSFGKSVNTMLFSMVPLVSIHKVLSTMIAIFEKSGYRDYETYVSEVVSTYSIEFYALWILANLENNSSDKLEKNSAGLLRFEQEKALLLSVYGSSTFISSIDESFKTTISEMSQKLWFVEGKDPNYKPPIERTNFR